MGGWGYTDMDTDMDMDMDMDTDMDMDMIMGGWGYRYGCGYAMELGTLIRLGYIYVSICMTKIDGNP